MPDNDDEEQRRHFSEQHRRRMHEQMRRATQARRLGPLALLRLRAELLLERDDHDLRPPLTAAERAELEGITVAPREDDRDWLNGFDGRFNTWP